MLGGVPRAGLSSNAGDSRTGQNAIVRPPTSLDPKVEGSNPSRPTTIPPTGIPPRGRVASAFSSLLRRVFARPYRAPARASQSAGARTRRRQVRAPVDLASPCVTRTRGEHASLSVVASPDPGLQAERGEPQREHDHCGHDGDDDPSDHGCPQSQREVTGVTTKALPRK